MRNLIFAFLGAMGLTLLALPIAVHRGDSGDGAKQQITVPVSSTSVAEVGQIAADNRDDRTADQSAGANREPAASDNSGKQPAAESSDPRPAAHQRQKTINVDLSDLVIRPV